MKRMYMIVTVFFLFLGVSQAGFAADHSWEVDKAHSIVTFRIDHIIGKVSGLFNEFDVDVVFDPAEPEKASFKLEIKVNSIDTNIGKRDKHLVSADFFDAGKYPVMTFTSESVSDAGDGHLSVVGSFVVKGKEHELTLPVKFLGIKDHPMMKGSRVAGFEIETTLDRLAYGVGNGSFYKNGVVGKDVEIFVSLEVLGK